MPVPLSSLKSGDRINFTLLTAVYSRTRFTNFTFSGKVGYDGAQAITPDLAALVAATKAYFRSGSSTNPTSIEYVLVKETATTKILVIPEPLFQLDTVELVSNLVHTIVVEDDFTMEELQQICTGNGLKKFTITSNQT